MPFAVLVLAGALAQPAAAGDAERQTAAFAVFACLDRAVPAIDDLQSDAATIAEAAVGMCEQQFLTMDETYFAGESRAVRQLMVARSPENHLKIALRAVLRFRNETRPKRP